MKKFEFKLEALLKLRTFKEKQIKQELGNIVAKMNETKQLIQQQHADIDIGYESQQNLLDSTVTGRELNFYPGYFSGKRSNINILEEQLEELGKEYNQKVLELNKARGETKVIEKLKEKDQAKHKKQVLKKEEADREDLIFARKNLKIG